MPDSDPRSPRYEPPHLRHQPGDTWIIDRNRPHDPVDPGHYGSAGWYPDERTGRHRRGELPDDPNPQVPQSVRPPSEQAEEPRPIRPVFRPSPERKSVPPGFSADPSPEEAEPEAPSRPRRYRWEDSAEQDQYNFGKLREDAWIGFLEGSQQFHDAHFESTSSLAERFAQALRVMVAFLMGIFRVRKCSADGSEATAEKGLAGVEPNSHRLADRARSKPSPQPRVGMGGNPGQGSHRTSPVSSFVLDWERHFDASQAFREAVTL